MFENSLAVFLVILDDGLGCRVVDAKFLGDLSDKMDVYIDDAPAFLNAPEQFSFCLFSHFFVFLAGLAVLDVDGSHFIEDQLDSRGRLTFSIDGLDFGTHSI
jgi:hypothetical protein